MRILTALLGFLCLLVLGSAASAKSTYITATGEKVQTFDVFQDCDACPEMIVLPLGKFQMGSSVEEAIAAHRRFFANKNVDYVQREEKLKQSFINLGIDPEEPAEGLLTYYMSGKIKRKDDPQYSAVPFLHEVPAHQVLIDMPIAMGRNEVTRAEWAECVRDGWCGKWEKHISRQKYFSCKRDGDCFSIVQGRVPPSQKNGPFPKYPRIPMVNITFYDMQDYVAWLNDHVGNEVYRIPIEAEWEYAARAGTTTRFAQGDILSLNQANFLVSRRDIVDGKYVWNSDLGSAQELLSVDALEAANAWGLRHMSGNASEFTSTCGSGPHRALASSSQYSAADLNRQNCDRSVKGGMYRGNVELARPARRVAISSTHSSPSIGFRVVRDLTPLAHPTN